MGVINLGILVRKIMSKIARAGYIKDTDYASSTKGGTIKTDSTYATDITSGGKLKAKEITAEAYSEANDAAFISKATLDNVLAAQPAAVTMDLLFSGNLSAGAATYALSHNYTDYDLLLCNQQSAADYATGGWVTAVSTLLTGSGKYNNLGANAKIGFDPSDPDAFTTSSDTGATTGYMIYGIKF